MKVKASAYTLVYILRTCWNYLVHLVLIAYIFSWDSSPFPPSIMKYNEGAEWGIWMGGSAPVKYRVYQKLHFYLSNWSKIVNNSRFLWFAVTGEQNRIYSKCIYPFICYAYTQLQYTHKANAQNDVVTHVYLYVYLCISIEGASETHLTGTWVNKMRILWRKK